MQLHQLKSIRGLKRKKRVGRGGKRGSYSGKGQKGQKSRAGRKMVPIIREAIKRYPKLRGYKFKAAEKKFALVNIDGINAKFENSQTVSPKTLLEKKLIRRIRKRVPMVKILGDGELTKSLIIEDCAFSKSAKEKIEKAGGKII